MTKKSVRGCIRESATDKDAVTTLLMMSFETHPSFRNPEKRDKPGRLLANELSFKK